MKSSKILTDRQLIVKTLKQNAKIYVGLKAIEEALTKRTNINWYSNEEAANYIGVSTKQLYRYRLNGKLKEYRNPNNGCLRFRKVDLDNFLNGKQNGSR